MFNNLMFYSIIFQKILKKQFNFADFKKHGFYSSLDTATEAQKDQQN